MDPIILHSYSDQSISPYNRNFRNPRQNSVPLMSRPSENFAPSIIHGGLVYPPFSPLLTQQQRQNQPPLLPLPIAKPYNQSSNNYYNSRIRGLSCPPINRKINNRSKHQSLTPKKSKPLITTTSPKKEESKQECSKSSINSTEISSESLIIESTNRLGPEPNVVSRALSSSSSGNFSNINEEEDEVVKFSGSIMFTISPPPSSLPLPTFSLRPKLSCKAEAAEIDAGATDSLRRLLRLR